MKQLFKEIQFKIKSAERHDIADWSDLGTWHDEQIKMNQEILDCFMGLDKRIAKLERKIKEKIN
jgi:hypothetical protein